MDSSNAKQQYRRCYSRKFGRHNLGTLTNSTTTIKMVTYDVIPIRGACQGVPFQLTVTVWPFPVMNNIEQTVCSGENMLVTTGVMSATPILWTWTVLSNSGVAYNAPNNVQADTNSDNIISIGTLSNPTNTVQTIVFDVTPSYASPACSGSSFKLKAYVQPKLQINPIAINGCAGDPFAIVVTVNPVMQAQALLISNALTYCAGESVLLTANVTPAGNYIYDWYRNNVLVTSGSSNTHVSSGLTSRATGYQYHVVVRSATVCGESRSNTVAITVTDPQTVVVTLKYTDICESGTIRATANIAQPNDYSYKWFLDNVEAGYGRLFTATNLSLGTHTLRVVATPLANCVCCDITSAPVTFTVHPNPAVTIAAGNAVLCAGNTAVLRVYNITLNAAVNNISNYTLQWALNGTVINGAIQDTYNQILNEPGTYQFMARMIATNDMGCTSEWSAPVTVKVENGLRVLLVSDAEACMVGESVTLTANVTPTGNYRYDWYLDNVHVVVNGGNTLVSKDLTVRSTSYMYHVEVRTGSGCDSRSNNIAITVYESKTVAVSLNHADICQGGLCREG